MTLQRDIGDAYRANFNPFSKDVRICTRRAAGRVLIAMTSIDLDPGTRYSGGAQCETTVTGQRVHDRKQRSTLGFTARARYPRAPCLLT